MAYVAEYTPQGLPYPLSSPVYETHSEALQFVCARFAEDARNVAILIPSPNGRPGPRIEGKALRDC
jgi:hypothetical protein